MKCLLCDYIVNSDNTTTTEDKQLILANHIEFSHSKARYLAALQTRINE